MHEAEEILDVVIEACRDAPEILEPRVEPLDLPAAAVCTDF